MIEEGVYHIKSLTTNSVVHTFTEGENMFVALIRRADPGSYGLDAGVQTSGKTAPFSVLEAPTGSDDSQNQAFIIKHQDNGPTKMSLETSECSSCPSFNILPSLNTQLPSLSKHLAKPVSKSSCTRSPSLSSAKPPSSVAQSSHPHSHSKPPPTPNNANTDVHQPPIDHAYRPHPVKTSSILSVGSSSITCHPATF
ncbi:hypothetical protein V5O48_010946 [Marasmius crinis-equi]|uniref:Uncharacterized protein n=1 Tax=Marasmius crinis-equi TaxID=585013 RepID=A0ABR3F6Y2_9AGAR